MPTVSRRDPLQILSRALRIGGGVHSGVESNTHTTEYDGGAPDEGGAESADGRRPQNLI